MAKQKNATKHALNKVFVKLVLGQNTLLWCQSQSQVNIIVNWLKINNTLTTASIVKKHGLSHTRALIARNHLLLNKQLGINAPYNNTMPPVCITRYLVALNKKVCNIVNGVK